MRISFDLDEVLFVHPSTHKIEPPPPFPFDHIFKERLRYGAPDLINSLQKLGYEVWIYTSSFRTERYIKFYFLLYKVRFDGIVNAMRHLKEVQGTRKDILPQKLPSRYRISLHIDDEEIVVKNARAYGYRVMRVYEPDEHWAEKIIDEAERIRKLEEG